MDSGVNVLKKWKKELQSVRGIDWLCQMWQFRQRQGRSVMVDENEFLRRKSEGTCLVKEFCLQLVADFRGT